MTTISYLFGRLNNPLSSSNKCSGRFFGIYLLILGKCGETGLAQGVGTWNGGVILCGDSSFSRILSPHLF